MKNWRWFVSAKIRRATDACNHVERLLDAQRDILDPKAVSAIRASLVSARAAIASGNANYPAEVEKMEKTAVSHLKPYPNSAWRENIEVLLVAVAVAMGIRTFFLQPFKIPTGSMQPTFYGIMVENMLPTGESLPHGIHRLWDAAVHGVFYTELIAEDDGQVVDQGPPEHFARFINKQTVTVQYPSQVKTYTLWFTPDETSHKAGFFLERGRQVKKGEPIIRMKEVSGDHLFVDRITYNFRHPTRGEVVVFQTRGIQDPRMQQDQFYIKRLVGLPTEQLQISKDRHLIVNGEKLTAATPHFENVYSFRGTKVDEWYKGHGHPADSFFPDENATFTIPAKSYMVMGDNTENSWDSRNWGPVPQTNVIGKSFFVYWPISNHGTSRFGWGQR